MSDLHADVLTHNELNVHSIFVCSNCSSVGAYVDKVFHWFRPEDPKSQLLKAHIDPEWRWRK